MVSEGECVRERAGVMAGWYFDGVSKHNKPDDTGGSTSGMFGPGLVKASGVHLLVSLVALIIASPFLAEFEHEPVVAAAIMTWLFAAGVVVSGSTRRALVIGIVLFVPAVVLKWLSAVNPALTAWSAGFSVLLLGFVMMQLLGYIQRARRVDTEVVCTGVSIYLSLGIQWSLLYSIVAALTDGAFVRGMTGEPVENGFELMYFSFVTLGTLGYGDIVPVSNIARMLAMVESMTGVLVLAVLIARLVSLHPGQKRAAEMEQE